MMAASVVIAIEKKQSFLDNPPVGWQRDASTSKMTCLDGSVTVIVDDKKFMGRDSFFDINSIEELDQVRRIVRSKPIFTTAKCSIDYDDRSLRQKENPTSDHTDPKCIEEYAVVVNTAHPQIINMFNAAFDKAEYHLKRDENFRVTVSISKSLHVWFMENSPVNGKKKDTTYAINCDVYLTRGTKAPTFADRCFSCGATIQKVFWCICFPFFLLCALPYMLYKRFYLGVIETKLGEALPISFHKNPFPQGFNIMHMLYPPGSSFTTITQYYQQPAVTLQPLTIQQPGYPQPGYQQPGYPSNSTQSQAYQQPYYPQQQQQLGK